MKDNYISYSPQETQEIAGELAKTPGLGAVTLTGDLGYGKTTFVQGFAKGLGISHRILSPTFIIMRTYDIPGSDKRLYHIDLYRIKSTDDLKSLGIEEVLNDPKAIVIIEWPDKFIDILPQQRLDITFVYVSDSQRRINIKKT